MLPKYHVLIGLILAFSLWLIFPQISFFGAVVIFLSSVLIDFDHYAVYCLEEKDLSLENSYKKSIEKRYIYQKKVKKNPKLKFRAQLFHTIEFIALIFILSLYNNFFLYVFIGIFFHSVVDVIDMVSRKVLRAREFSLIRYFVSDKRNYF